MGLQSPHSVGSETAQSPNVRQTTPVLKLNVWKQFLWGLARVAKSDTAHRQRANTKWKRKCSDCKVSFTKKGNIRSLVTVKLLFTHNTLGHTYLLRAWALLVSSAAFLFTEDFRGTLLSFGFWYTPRRIREDPPLLKKDSRLRVVDCTTSRSPVEKETKNHHYRIATSGKCQQGKHTERQGRNGITKNIYLWCNRVKNDSNDSQRPPRLPGLATGKVEG